MIGFSDPPVSSVAKRPYFSTIIIPLMGANALANCLDRLPLSSSRMHRDVARDDGPTPFLAATLPFCRVP